MVKATVKILSADETINHHAMLGWQCPECYGVQVQQEQSRFEANTHRFVCNECGCQWSNNQ